MPDNETATAEAPTQPPDAGLAPGPVQAGAPIQSGPPAEPGPEAQPAEGGEGGAEPEADSRWWPAIDSEEGLRGHESVQAWLQEERQSAQRDGLAEARKQMQPRVDARNAHLGALSKGLSEFWRGFDEFREGFAEGTGDAEALDKLLKRHGETLQGLTGVHFDGGLRGAYLGYQGSQGQVAGFIGSIFGDDGDTADTFRQRAENVFDFGIRDDSFFSEMREALVKSAHADWEKKETTRIEKQVRERVEAEERQAVREKLGQPPKVQGGGGGGGGLSYRTKAEARTLHVQGKISNTQMRQINADPSIPEM